MSPHCVISVRLIRWADLSWMENSGQIIPHSSLEEAFLKQPTYSSGVKRLKGIVGDMLTEVKPLCHCVQLKLNYFI